MASDIKVSLDIVQGQPLGKRLTFRPGEYYFGRGAECQVRPNSEWVSRQHCRLRVTSQAAFLQDLGSRNGTLINGELVTEERPLQEGDQIQIGPLAFEVRITRVAPQDIHEGQRLPDSESSLRLGDEPGSDEDADDTQDTTNYPHYSE
jgi:pSer/pThr/pTyr-binding forkhead associated (FHA) protein